jgi:hypothetical protein
MKEDKVSTPEKPCPWNAGEINPTTGVHEIVYCEVGPAGHEGSHVGDRTRDEYFRRLREWRDDIPTLVEKRENTRDRMRREALGLANRKR